MSDVIENQIVQMSFDNKEFEKNISTSMKSLDDFKKELEFSEEASNFKELEKVSESVDFDKLNKAVDNVGNHFTLLGRIGYKVVDDLATYFTSKIESMVNSLKSVTIDILDPKAGYAKYDEYTHGVKNILAALTDDNLAKLESQYGTAIDGVESKLEELMAYTDETSYNFTDMVATIGKFLGAGIDLDSAVADMQGIANWAALSGQNATTASQAMYQMSQALGAGYVKYQDWTQMANLKSMGTTAAKDVFIEAAKEVGTITEEEIKHARELLGGANATEAQIRNWFFEAKQLNDENARWLTTEVLEKGLQKFSSVSNEVIPLVNDLNDGSSLTVTQFLRMGNQMKKTGASAKEMVDALTAKGSIRLVGEDYDRVVASLEKLTSEEYKVGWNALKAAQEATTFTEAIDATKDAVGTQWMKIFKDLIGNYEEAAELWTDLANNLYDTFAAPLYEAEITLKDWANSSVSVIDEFGNEVEITMRKYMWQGLSNVFAASGNLFSSLFASINNFSDKSLGDRIVGFFQRLTDALHGLADVLNSVADSETVSAISKLFRDLITLGATLFDIFRKIISAIWQGVFGGDALDETLSAGIFTIDSLVVGLTHLLDKFNNSKGFAKTLSVVKTLIQGVVSVLRVFMTTLWLLADLIRGKFSIASVEVKNAFIGLWEWIAKLFKFDATKGAKKISSAFDIIGKGVNKLTSLVKEFFTYWADNFGFYIDHIKKSESIIGGILFSIIDMVGTFAADVIDAIAGIFGIDATDFTDKIYGFFNKAGSIAQKAIESIGPSLEEAVYGVSWFVFEGIPNAFTAVIDSFKDGTAPQKLKEALKSISSAIKDGVNDILDGIGKLIGYDMDPFKSKIMDFISRFTAEIEKLKPGFADAWDMLAEVFGKLVNAFKILAEGLFDIISKVTGIEDFGPEKFLDLVFWILQQLVGIFVWLVSTASGAIVAAGPYILAIADLIGEGLSQIWLAFRKLIGIDNSDDATRALDNIKKVLKDIFIVIMLLEAYKFFKSVRYALTGFSDLTDQITGWSPKSLMASLTRLFKAIAFLMLSFSILANQDIQGVAMAAIAFAVVMKILSKVFKQLLTDIEVIAKHIKKKVIDVKGVEAGMASITSVVNIIAKMLLKIAVSLTIIAWASDKFGSDNMLTAILGLATMILVLSKGVQIILKATDKMSSNDKKLKQTRKIINKITTSLTVIASAFGVLVKVIDMTMNNSNNGEMAVSAAMLMLLGALVALVLGTSMVILVGRWSSANELKSVAQNIWVAGVMLSLIAVAISFAVKNLDSSDMKGNWDKLKVAAVALAGIVGAIVVLAFVLSKILNKNTVSNLNNVAQILAQSVGSMLLIGMAIPFLAASVGLIIAAAMLIDFFITFGGGIGKILESLALAVAIYFASALVFRMIAGVKIVADPAQLMSAGLMLMELSLAVLALAGALAILSGITIDDDMKGAIQTVLLLVGVLLLFSVAVSVLGANLGAISSLALGLVEFAGALYLIAGALAIFSLLDMTSAMDNITEFGKMLLLYLGIIGLIALIVGAIPGAADVIDALGKAVLRFALGLAILMAVIIALSVIDTLVDDMINALNNLQERLPELVETLVQVLVVLLNSLADSLLTHAEEIGEGLYKLLLAIVGIVFTLFSKIYEEALLPVLESIGKWFSDLWSNICSALATAWEGIVDFFTGLYYFFVNLWDEIIGIFKDVYEFFAGIINTIWDAISGTASDLWQGVIELFIDMWEGICGVFSFVYDFFCDVITSIWEGIKDTVKTVRTWISNKIETIWNAIKAPFTAAFDLGKDIVTGLWNGINDMVEWIVEKIKSFCKNALDAIKAFFGISSPSKVMAEMGGYLMEGFGEGVEDNQGVAIDACEEASTNMLEEMQDVLGIHSASTKTKGMGLNLMQGFTDGVNAGEGGLLNTVKSVGGDILSTFASSVGGSGTLGMITGLLSGSYDVSSMIDTSSIQMPEMDVANFNIDGYTYNGQAFDPNSIGLSSVYDMDLAASYNGAGLNIPATYTPTVTDAQIDQISSSYEDNSKDIVNKLDEIEKRLTEQAEIMSKYQMVLDTGVLVGELATPIDRAIGNRARLANGRGI